MSLRQHGEIDFIYFLSLTLTINLTYRDKLNITVIAVIRNAVCIAFAQWWRSLATQEIGFLMFELPNRRDLMVFLSKRLSKLGENDCWVHIDQGRIGWWLVIAFCYWCTMDDPKAIRSPFAKSKPNLDYLANLSEIVLAIHYASES